MSHTVFVISVSLVAIIVVVAVIVMFTRRCRRIDTMTVKDFDTPEEYISWVDSMEEKLREEHPDNWENTLGQILIDAYTWAYEDENKNYQGKYAYSIMKFCYEMDDFENSLKFSLIALEIYGEILVDDERQNADTIGCCSNYAGLSSRELGRYGESIECHEEAIGLYRTLAEESPDDIRIQAAIAETTGYLADVYSCMKKWDKASEKYEESMSLYDALLKNDPSYLQDVATGHWNLGAQYLEMNDTSKALLHYKKAIRLYEETPDVNREYLEACKEQYDLLRNQ